jgi:hypothetical protein
VHAFGHVPGIAANVEERSARKPFPQFLCLLEHSVLDVNLLGSWSREKAKSRRVSTPWSFHARSSSFVEEIGGAMLFTEKQPVFAGSAFDRPLLEKRPERGNAGARTHHDDVPGLVARQTEAAGFLDVNRHGLHKHIRMISQETGRKTLFRPSMRFITHDRYAQVRFARMRLDPVCAVVH